MDYYKAADRAKKYRFITSYKNDENINNGSARMMVRAVCEGPNQQRLV